MERLELTVCPCIGANAIKHVGIKNIERIREIREELVNTKLEKATIILNEE